MQRARRFAGKLAAGVTDVLSGGGPPRRSFFVLCIRPWAHGRRSAPSCSSTSPFWQRRRCCSGWARSTKNRSEEHTSELQSPCNLVCRLLLEKKKQITSLLQQCTKTRAAQ